LLSEHAVDGERERLPVRADDECLAVLVIGHAELQQRGEAEQRDRLATALEHARRAAPVGASPRRRRSQDRSGFEAHDLVDDRDRHRE
jgi:hypothetical protein